MAKKFVNAGLFETSMLGESLSSIYDSLGITDLFDGLFGPVVRISGSLLYGNVLTATISDSKGVNSPTYQWQRNGSNISGETSSTYTTDSGDIDDVIACYCTWTDDEAEAKTATSTGVTVTWDQVAAFSTDFTTGPTAENAPDSYSCSSTRYVEEHDGRLAKIPIDALPFGGLLPGYNLLAGPTDTLSTETVTVVSGAKYIVSAEGSGSITLSGADTSVLTGDESNRKAVAFTAASTSLTLTVSGTVTDAQLENSTHYPDPTIPREYAEVAGSGDPHSTGVDGFKYQTNDNSNVSVVSGVVTGSGGNALTGDLDLQPGVVNEMSDPDDLTAWTSRGSVAITYTDGHSEVRSLGASGVSDVYKSILSVAGGIQRFEPSFWLRTVSSSGTLIVKNSTSGAGRWNIDLSLVSSSAFEVINRNHPSVSIVAEFSSNSSGHTGLQFYADSGSLDVDIQHVQIESGSISTLFHDGTRAAPVGPVRDYTTPQSEGMVIWRGTVKALSEQVAALIAFNGTSTTGPLLIDGGDLKAADGTNTTTLSISGADDDSILTVACCYSGSALEIGYSVDDGAWADQSGTYDGGWPSANEIHQCDDLDAGIENLNVWVYETNAGIDWVAAQDWS
jgi:hypothetical protein